MYALMISLSNIFFLSGIAQVVSFHVVIGLPAKHILVGYRPPSGVSALLDVY